MSIRKMVGASAMIAVFLFLGVFSVHADLSKSVGYLEANPSNPWVTMALVAAGQTPDTEYLKTATCDKAVDCEAPILALTATGQNPSVLVAKLKSFANGNQIGDPVLLNDDFFGVLALRSAGVSATDAVIADSVNFIKSHQQSDGSWNYATDSTYSDPDMTAAAVMALRSTGISTDDDVLKKGVSFLKSVQGTNLNSSSEAWVDSALLSVGENPSLAHLQSLVGEDGKITDSWSDSFAPTGTAYAVIALSGKYFPVGSVSAEPTATPIPAGVSAKYLISGSAGTICTGTIKAVVAMDVVKNAAAGCGVTYHIKDTSFGPYLDKIGDDEAAGSSGWMYAVNNKAPSIGAGDYELIEGDGVVWYFGPFDMAIPALPATTGIEMSATINPTGTPPPILDSVGFEIDIKKLAFGTLKPGSVGTAQFTMKNAGTQPIQMLASVTGDALFRDYLKLADTAWRQFSLTLGSGQSSAVQAKLPVPASYESGTKSGTITFWATVAN